MANRPIAPNGEHVTYQRQRRKCGKKPCKTCEQGQGHGPYWYAYWRQKGNGRVTSAYIGKKLPPEAYVSSEEQEGQPGDTPIPQETIEVPARSRQRRLRHPETGNTITEEYQPSLMIPLAAVPV